MHTESLNRLTDFDQNKTGFAAMVLLALAIAVPFASLKKMAGLDHQVAAWILFGMLYIGLSTLFGAYDYKKFTMLPRKMAEVFSAWLVAATASNVFLWIFGAGFSPNFMAKTGVILCVALLLQIIFTRVSSPGSKVVVDVDDKSYSAVELVENARRGVYSKISLHCRNNVADLEKILEKLKEIDVEISVNGVREQNRTVCGIALFAKETIDRTIAALVFPLLLIAAPFLWVIVKLDSRGFFLFKQERGGYNGVRMEIYKIRTLAQDYSGGDTVREVTEDDRRITRIGRFLRKTSIDELPQIVNVMRGEMSLVGPRPHAVQHDKQYGAYIGSYRQRFRAKPGITGYAQVSGSRGATHTVDVMKRRVILDRTYIKKWSLWLDLKIIYRTFGTVFSRKNAF